MKVDMLLNEETKPKSIFCIIYVCIYIGMMVSMFANGPGDLGSIPGKVIPKTQKMVLDAPLLSTQHYKVWIKGKLGNAGKGVVPFPTPWCSSYRKGSFRVIFDYGRQLYLLYIRIFAAASHQTGQDTRSAYIGNLRDGEVGHEPKLEPC